MGNKIKNIFINKKMKLVLISLFFLLSGILINFPFSEIISLYTSKVLDNPSCPISYNKHNIYYFPPGISIKELLIPAICSQNNFSNLKLKQLNIKFNGLSFFPLGVRLGLYGKTNKSHFKIDLLFSFSSLKLRINNSSINALLINNLTGQNELLDGLFNIKALISLKNNKLSNGNFSATSKNLKVNSKMIMGFQIPMMKINTFKAIGKVVNSKLIKISNFTIGDSLSPVIIRLKGKINLNQNNIMSSILDLKGEIKFSENFLNQMAILKLMLNGKKKSNGFYSILLSGRISAPTPKIL